jgi:two-component system, cell cycle response regulator
MEQLIRQALSTLADLGYSEQVAIFGVKNNQINKVLGGFSKGKTFFPDKTLFVKGTALEKIIATKQVGTYSCAVIDSLPVPLMEKIQNGQDCLCLPLFNDQKNLMGIAVIMQQKGIPLSDCRAQSLSIIRSLIATALQLAIENQTLYQLANIDTFTGLYTQRYLEKRLQEEVVRVRRHGGLMSLLMIDVDHFKQINESCGLQEASRILQEVAELVGNSVRKEIDIASRYENEQFVILLPNTNIDGAYILAERIRQRCEYHVFTTLQGLPFKVTLSIGIANNTDVILDDKTNEERERKELSAEEIIRRAEVMLQAARQAGRNQVMVWW